MDITAELREAAAALKPGDCIASAAYSPEGAMNALELMEPKLDPGFHPAPLPVAQRIKNGSLPLVTLTTEQVVAVMDHLIALEQSFMSGNTYPQTLAGSLYTHPVTMQTLRSLLGLPAYKHATEGTIHDIKKVALINSSGTTTVTEPAAAMARGEPLQLVAAPEVLPVTDGLSPLETGSPQHTLLLALLAFVTSTLKSVELKHRAVLQGDLWEEDDYYWLLNHVDLCWTVTEQQVCELIDRADAALAAAGEACGKVKCRPLTGVAERFPVSSALAEESEEGFGKPLASFLSAGAGHEVTPLTDAASSSSADETVVAAQRLDDGFVRGVRSRLLFRRAYLCGQALLNEKEASSGGSSASPLLPSWARRYRLGHAREAFAGAITALLGFSNNASAKEASASATASVPGFFAEYLRLHLPSNVPRMTPVPSVSNALDGFKLHLTHLQIITQLPALASHNPFSGVIASGASKSIVPDVRTTAPRMQVQESAALPFDLNPAAAAPEPTRAIDMSVVPEGLADILAAATASASASASASAASEASLNDLKAAASALKWPSAAKRDFAAAAASVTGPQPVIPYAEPMDLPLWWPSSDAAAAGNPAMPADPSAPFRPHGFSGSPRRHVSLHALLSVMEDVTRLNADVVVRSMLAYIALQAPPQHIVDAAAAYVDPYDPDDDDEASAPAASKGKGKVDDDRPVVIPAWRSTQARCHTVFGTHTMLELLQRCFVDVGVPLEQLCMEECRRLLDMLTAPIATLVRYHCWSRLRMRRKMDTQFRDWQVIVGEADVIDSIASNAMEERTKQGVASLYTALGIAAALGDKGFLGVNSASVAAGAAGKAGKAGGAAKKDASSSPMEVLAAADAFPPTDQLSFWNGHIDVSMSHPMLMKTATWALTVVLRLMLTNVEVGFEDGVYHSDELSAVYWYHDHLLAQYLRFTKGLQHSRLAVDMVPELCGIPVCVAASHVHTAEREEAQRNKKQNKEQEASAAPAAPAAAPEAGLSTCPSCFYSRNPSSRLHCEACYAPLPECKRALDAIPLSQRARWGLDTTAPAADAAADVAAGASAPADATAAAGKKDEKSKKKGGKKGGAKGSKGKGGGGGGEDDDDALLLEAASASGTIDSAFEAMRTSVFEGISDRSPRTKALSEFLRLNSLTHWSTPTLDLASAQADLCKGHIRVLAALNLAGLYRSIHNPQQPQQEDGSTALLRNSALAFANRFKDFRLLSSPRPMSFQDFKTSFTIERFDGDTVANVVLVALKRYELALETLKRCRMRALQGLADLRKAAAAGEATRSEDLCTLVLCDTTARAIKQPDAPAAAKASGAGGKKGKAAAAAPVEEPAPRSKPAFGLTHDVLTAANALAPAIALVKEREEWLAHARHYGGAPLNAVSSRPAPLTTFAVLQAGRQAQQLERLVKVTIANKLFASTLQRGTGAAFDTVFRNLLAPVAAPAAGGKKAAAPATHRTEPLPLLPAKERAKISFETDASFATIALATPAATPSAAAGDAAAATPSS